MSMGHGFNKVVFDQATGDKQTIIPSPGLDKRIRIRGGILSAASVVLATFQSGNTELGGHHLGLGAPLVMPPTDGGVHEEYFICAANEAFSITLSAAVQANGVIFYDTLGKGSP